MRLARLAAAALAAAGCVTPVGAAHPLLTEDTGTQGLGNAQLELMVDKTRDGQSGSTVREQVATAVLSYGVLENADLQFGVSHVRQQIQDAFGRHASKGPLDASVDFKWRFFEHEALSLGVKPGVTLPTGDKNRGFGNGRATWGGLLILSCEPGPLSFHAHVGYRRNSNVTGQRTSLRHVSVALTYETTERLKLVADLSAETNPDTDVRGSMRYRILGLIYSPVPSFDLDVGLKHGYGQAATDRALLFGATLRW